MNLNNTFKFKNPEKLTKNLYTEIINYHKNDTKLKETTKLLEENKNPIIDLIDKYYFEIVQHYNKSFPKKFKSISYLKYKRLKSLQKIGKLTNKGAALIKYSEYSSSGGLREKLLKEYLLYYTLLNNSKSIEWSRKTNFKRYTSSVVDLLNNEFNKKINNLYKPWLNKYKPISCINYNFKPRRTWRWDSDNNILLLGVTPFKNIRGEFRHYNNIHTSEIDYKVLKTIGDFKELKKQYLKDGLIYYTKIFKTKLSLSLDVLYNELNNALNIIDYK